MVSVINKIKQNPICRMVNAHRELCQSVVNDIEKLKPAPTKFKQFEHMVPLMDGKHIVNPR